MEFNSQLQDLQDKIIRKNKIESMMKDLHKQSDELLSNMISLEEIKLKEQKDVEKLEGRSLASFFYTVIGRKDEKLNEEQAEAYNAQVKYDSAVEQQNSIQQQILNLEKEYVIYRSCEREYKQLMDQKIQWIKENDASNGDKIIKMEEQIMILKSQMKEISDALTAGRRAMDKIESIEGHLSSAEGWGTWDLLGGGLISDMAKHSHLDDAQSMIQDLQELLRQLRTELADIKVSAEIQVQIEGFLRFADYFFDGLFSDWAVLDSIHSSQSQISDTKSKVQNIINKLIDMKRAAEHGIVKLKEDMDAVIQQA